MHDLQHIIEEAFEIRSTLANSGPHVDIESAVEEAISMLDTGKARIAEKIDGEWQVNQWLKKAVLLSFALRENQIMPSGETNYYDKVSLKYVEYTQAQFQADGVRVVPPATVRKGSYVASGTVLMPSYVNIGAYIDSGSMVDTWATVGSCAQIGKNVHLSGGVGIGGVLEPLQAGPVIIEDNCFIGARSEIVEGVIVEEGSVISMGVYIGQSTKILDRETGEVSYGRIPTGSVVVSGSIPSKDGSHSLYCAVIVKKVDEKTRSKTSLNELLRDDQSERLRHNNADKMTEITMDHALELTKTLISAQSVTPNDKGCQDLMIERLETIGFAVERMPFSDSHGNVDNFWARRGQSKPVLAFAGHTDVVPTGDADKWQNPPFDPQIIDGQLYGRGAADMKSSLAAFIVAAEHFVAAHPDHAGSLAFLITSDEEGPATCGTRKVIETLEQRQEKIDYCLVGEPSSTHQLGDVIKNGRRGSIGCELIIIGVQGHIAYPHLAHNPIPIAARVIQRLDGIGWDTGNEYFQPTSLQFSNINSGTGATNVIPGYAKIVFNLRFSTEITAEQIIQRIESELAEMAIDFEAEWRIFGEPFLTPKGVLVAACENAIQATCGIQPKLSTSGGTSDGRFIAPTGAQVVELGPINATIHKVDEHVPADSPRLLSEIYTKVMQNILLDTPQ